MTNFEYCFKNLQIEFNFCGVLNLEPEDIILQQTEFASARYIASEKKYLINYRNEHDIWRLIYETFNYNLKSDFQIFINHTYKGEAKTEDIKESFISSSLLLFFQENLQQQASYILLFLMHLNDGNDSKPAFQVLLQRPFDSVLLQ